MKYLSIYNDEWEVRDFLRQNDFDVLNDDDDDLLSLFEGDPDFIDIKQPSGYYSRVYFAQFHKDYTYEGEQVVITSAEDSEDCDAVQRYFEKPSDFEMYEPNTWEAMNTDNEHSLKVAYRGGMGYIYTLSFAM